MKYPLGPGSDVCVVGADIVAELHLVESLLRRKMTGLSLQEVILL